MKALGLAVSDKKIFESFILKTYLLTPWPTYATNWNGLNNFDDRGPPRDHSCEVWSKSNKWFQRRCCLKKLLTDGRTDARTHARTDDGRRTLKDHKSSLEHFVLRWAKKTNQPECYNKFKINLIIKHVALDALFRSLPVLKRGIHFYLLSRHHQNQMLESCHHHQMAPRFLPVLK